MESVYGIIWKVIEHKEEHKTICTIVYLQYYAKL